MASTLRIMAWNANGLLQHKEHLLVTLIENKIDVCLISETHFTRESYLKLRGFEVYHTVHPSNCARGGSAVIVKTGLVHHEDVKIEKEEFQVTSITLKTSAGAITVGAIYSPPRHNLKRGDYLSLLQSFPGKFILGGDFNSKHTSWGSRLTNAKGTELYQAIQEHRCEVHTTGKPTYWPTDLNKLPDLIDFFISKNLSPGFIEVTEEFDLDSDHSPIVLTLSAAIIKKGRLPTLTNCHTDWDVFQAELITRINLRVPLTTSDELEEEVLKFVADIQHAAWEATPSLPTKVKGNSYPLEVRERIAVKRKLRKRWQLTRDPRIKTELNRVTQDLRRTILAIKQQSIAAYLQDLTDDASTDYSLWKATKRLKRPVMSIPPLRKPDNTWAKDDKEKADVFAAHLERTFQPYRESTLATSPKKEEKPKQRIPLVTPKELRQAIRAHINPKKAPGHDLITGVIMQQLPRQAIVKLTHLYNAALRLKYVPSQWKAAEVIMVPKPGKPVNDVTSYRPISLLPIMSKLFEKLILKRLTPTLSARHIIPQHQFGFRHQHSTLDQVHRITAIIEQALEEKQICATIFLDVAQAFDKVWHAGLLHKIEQLLPPEYTQLLKSYLTDRYFRVKQGEEYSDLKPVKAGVPQGSVLGPVLYLIHTSDIPQPVGTTVATFADDTAILAVGTDVEEATEKLQHAADSINNWTKQWHIKLNTDKSKHVNFTNKRCRYLPVTMDGKIIPSSQTAKYLVMTLDAKLRWKVHVKTKREELRIKYRQMYWLLGRRSALSLRNKLVLYTQILKPVWTYGIQLWGCTTQSTIEVIQRFQNQVLRGMVNAPWYIRNADLHRDLNVELVTAAIRRFARKHEERLHQHVNVEAIQLLDNSALVRRLKRTKPFELV